MKPLLLIIGPSGCGKSTFAQVIADKYNYKIVQSYTTRPKREENETGHIFITSEEFDKIRHKLVAYTNFNGYEYGITNDVLDQCEIYVIDLDGIKYLKERYISQRNIITIGVDVSPKICKQAMLNRGDSPEKVEQRLKHDKQAFNGYKKYCNIIIKGQRNLNTMLNELDEKLQNYL